MVYSNHYDTLKISPRASQAEIKQAYRRLAKLFHPDSNRETADHTKIANINAAYEVLGDPQRRQFYDRQLSYGPQARGSGFTAEARTASPHRSRRQREAEAQDRYQRRRYTSQNSDEQLQRWLKQVYQPIDRMLCQILYPLQEQLDDLSADPFDDELMEEFQAYLDDCRDRLSQSQSLFRSMPNPSNVAGVAAHLYYCLNQVGDGIDELERFTCSYTENYLHTGLELFRIANGLRREAQGALKALL